MGVNSGAPHLPPNHRDHHHDDHDDNRQIKFASSHIDVRIDARPTDTYSWGLA